MLNVHVTKTVPIEFKWVVDAYQKVRQGGKGTGIDNESWLAFDKNAEKNCYLIWNRLASGSYHAQAVRAAEIPRKDGSLRKLGIPTLRDRIAQQVIKDQMEKQIDHLFHEHSYGYRPLKSAHAALKQVQKNCLQKDWVIDMDIRKFFDEIDHVLLLKAVEHILPDMSWISMYVKRWLEAPVAEKDGSLTARNGKGTPQGGVISPMLANIYLHYTLDLWLSRQYPMVSFVRYADDMVVHCNSKQEAEAVLKSIEVRLSEVKLSVKKEKTHIAYCKDYRRKEEHDRVKFEFLGFSFQPMKMLSKKGDGSNYTGYGGGISDTNEKKITEAIRKEDTLGNTRLEIGAIAKSLNPKLSGWMNYYNLFSRYKLVYIMRRVDYRLLKWFRKKYKCGTRRANQQLNAIRQQRPLLFYHWRTCTGYNR